MLNRTITSLVTAPITQNIALIRVSGPQTYQIINQILDRPLPSCSENNSRLIFGQIINQKKEVIDQVLLLCFYQPYSFTGEDVVEISCHGNLFIVQQIITLLIENGAELAQPGEFTKQAFFNGKINLIQAQAINDLIRAPSLSAAKLAFHNLSEETQQKWSSFLKEVEEEILDIIATVCVNIDYPEYDGVEYLTGESVLLRLEVLANKLKEIKELGEKARIYQEGIKIAIIGKPNVGKSTLLNTLLQEEKVIVSPIAGTTRDIIEASYNLSGIPLTLLDTAGIHKTKNLIEKIGVEKSCQALKKANIIFFLVDNSRCWDKEDEYIYQLVRKKNYLLLVNKADIPSQLQIPASISATKIIKISAKNKQVQELENKIGSIFVGNLFADLSPSPYLSKSWQQAKLSQIINTLGETIIALQKKTPLDVLSWDLKTVYNLTKELSGKEYNEDLLDIIFKKFCLGK